MERLSDVEVFVRVVETSSFARAADILGISRSYASRMVSGLEERLGVRLLHRTTRRVVPTATGQAFYASCSTYIEGIAEAERRVREDAEEPQGLLRVSFPFAFGVRYLVQPVVEFQQRYPRVSVNVSYDDRKVDIVGEGFDLAVRGAANLEGPLIARSLWRFRLLLVASPRYLARRGVPLHPQELAQHDCVLYAGTSRPNTWFFANDEGELSVEVKGVLTMNNAHAQASAVIMGAGIAVLPDFEVVDALHAGTLARILPQWELPGGTFWVVRPDRQQIPARVRVFLDHLQHSIPDPPWLKVG